ncbi:hypothetical protein C9374_001806 [Naegleria lovaniensis]|uniref:Ras-GEF domain-containing protein n=1 Tax=Naegleria lovaniensis TaxID=51637 RepID=A0AA88KN07_NAELO|nr:uncharacterized protein C9374_001806 [Naegleria lovaniensis]KAG2387474.1 hypothetical protein C9374_001806 [Naegleria lovaniensis]
MTTEPHKLIDPAVFSSSFCLSDYFGMMTSGVMNQKITSEQQQPSEEVQQSTASTTTTTTETNDVPEFHYRVDCFNNCSETCRNFLKHFQNNCQLLSLHEETSTEPNHQLYHPNIDLDLKEHVEISSLIEQFIVTIESSPIEEVETTSNSGNSPNTSSESSSASTEKDLKIIDLATLDIKGKLSISKASGSIQTNLNSDPMKDMDSNKLWMQLDSLNGISFHKWIEKIIFPYLRLSNIPPKIYNHLNVWHDLIRINPELTQEMTEVFFACYPSLFKQLSEHYPYSNDQKNCHLLLAEYLIGILWTNYLTIHEKKELHIFNEIVMQRTLHCLKYWTQYYFDRFDFWTNQFVSNSLQELMELFQNLQLISEESYEKLSQFRVCLSSIRELLQTSQVQRDFPFSMSRWKEYVETKKEELGLNEKETPNEEEGERQSLNEQADTDIIQVVEEVAENGEEEDDEDEDDMDLSEMFHNLSCSIMSQFDLSQIHIPELFKDKLDESMLNSLLETTFDNMNDTDSSQLIQQFVLSFMKRIYPERSESGELENMPTTDLYFEFISLWSPLEIAKQLTNYEFVYCFEACNTHDFFATISKSSSNTHSSQNPYNLNHMIERFNWLSFWICYIILKQKDMKTRVKTMAYFVQVMFFVMCLQNYQSSMSILSAFHSTSIVKLSKAWDQLSTFENDEEDVTFNLPSFPYYQFLKGANELFSFDKKFFNLKCHIISEIEKKLQSNESESSISCIPYIGAFLGEISAIETYFNDFFSFNEANIPQHGHNKPHHPHHHHQHSYFKTNPNTTIHTHQIPHHYMFNYEKKKKITKPIKEIQTFQKLSRVRTTTDQLNQSIPHALFKPIPILHVLLSTSELIKSLPTDPKLSDTIHVNGSVNPLIRSDSLTSIGLDSPTLSTASNSSNNGSGFFQSQSVMALMALKSNAHSDYIKKIFREMAKEIVKNE